MDFIRLGSADDPMARALARRLKARLESTSSLNATIRLICEPLGEAPWQASGLARKLLAGEIDLAVLPAERLGATLPEGISVAAWVRDSPALYECVSTVRPRLSILPARSRVATCDRIARAQLKHWFPTLRVETVPMGDRVLEPLLQGLVQAVCLPTAALPPGLPGGLRHEPVPPGQVLPPAGAGCAAVLARDADASKTAALDDLTERPLRTAERAFLGALQIRAGVVQTARAAMEGGRLVITGMAADADGRWLVLNEAEAAPQSASQVARNLAASCAELVEHQQAQWKARSVASF